MTKPNQTDRARILSALCEGSSGRAVARILGVEQNTVMKMLADAGDMAIEFMADLKDLRFSEIQADELYAFIAAKEANVADMDEPSEDAGTSWTYLAMCVKSKMIFDYHIGARTKPEAEAFMLSVASKLKRRSDGDFEVRPHIATDGLVAYVDGFNKAFGASADFGMLVKSYAKGSGNQVRGKYEGATRKPIAGNADIKKIHTSYIERQNLNLRMGNRRFTRRTNAFSKTLKNHERHIALWLIYHNFIQQPRPMRLVDDFGQPVRNKNGKQVWAKRLTPAMEAGIASEIWTVEHLLKLTDAFQRERILARREARKAKTAALKALAKRAASDAVRAAYWVYHSAVHNTTKVHAADCANCRDGMGKSGKGATKSGRWLPFSILEEAKAAAAFIAPDDMSICNMCMGSYRSLGYRPLK